MHDVGDSLSPLVDLGQVEGGFVQGAGWLTLEDLRWDTSDRPSRGRLATQAASTYKLPSFSEMPEVFNVALLQQAHEDGAVYGSKAVGEPPLMLAFSVREALREAVAAAYDGEPFVHLLPEGQWPSTGSTLGSNAAHLQVTADTHAGRAIVISACCAGRARVSTRF